jgi:signal transduction histidine kinase
MVSSALPARSSCGYLFMKQGSVKLELVQQRDGTRCWMELSVMDTGVGIRPEDQAKLFQAFVQVDGGTQRLAEGTGLGWYLCRQLAELLGGQITLHSQEGVGSRFTLHLPQDCGGTDVRDGRSTNAVDTSTLQVEYGAVRRVLRSLRTGCGRTRT